jgi:uncharacterized membrane protein
MSEAIVPNDDQAGALAPIHFTGERRWPMALAVLVAAILQVIVPHRGRLPGWYLFPAIEIVLLACIMIADPGRIDRRSPALRAGTFVLITVMTVANSVGAVLLMYDIIADVRGINSTNLLGRGALIWVTNVIVFSLWYWELDRGGPAERAAGASRRASFAFPENATPELVPEGWVPTYPDYLYLSFTNSTAFSPTDTLPMRIWAKMTMLLQSVISLVTAILVIARAVNVLPRFR